jgi:hypothetical protein
MCNDPLFRLRQNEDFVNEMLSRPFNSYSEFKQREEDTKVLFLIKDKYLKLLGKFIETTYPDLRFDIYIRQRNPKEQKVQWYGHTYMELVVFDVIGQAIYDPMTFAPVYRTTTYTDHISMDIIYDDIESFIPEINKHLMITFIPYHSPDQMIPEQFFDLRSFECWDRYWRYNMTKPTHIFLEGRI